MTTFFIDPTAASGGNGSASHPFDLWSQATLSPGNVYLQRAGTSATANLEITGSNTGAAGLTIGSYGAGAAPILHGSIDIFGASHATIFGLTVDNPGGAAVLLQQGANHITVAGDTLTGSRIGLWIGNGAGGSDTIGGNTITGNSLYGIAVAQVANAPGQETTILSNSITGNGSHGFELDGDRFVVQNNTVAENGLATPGSSGIHVFGGLAGEPDGYGVGNTIQGNVAVGNHDRWGSDGNGIELDQYTHGNVVSGNVAAGNDGGGITLFDSYGDTVTGNLLAGNAVDPGHTHTASADLVVAEGIGLTAGNVIAANMVLLGARGADLLGTIRRLAHIS